MANSSIELVAPLLIEMIQLLLRKRAIIESIIDQIKNISQIEHSRHRSPVNFVVHLIAGLVAYSHQNKKLGLHLYEHALLAA
jgi:hypothetical protein